MIEKNVEELSDSRLLCLFCEISAKLYLYKALEEEGKPIDESEALNWIKNYAVVRQEVFDRGLMDEAFNQN